MAKVKETPVDPRVDKRRVTMRSIIAVPGVDDDGRQLTAIHEAVDYVRPDHLAEYVADAQSRWQVVEVSDEPDAGPAGYDGPTSVPAHLPVPDAGVVYPATPGSPVAKAIEESAAAAAEAAAATDGEG